MKIGFVGCENIIWTLLILTALIGNRAAQVAAQEENEIIYNYYPSSATWRAAKDNCAAQGMKLAEPSTVHVQQQDALHDYLVRLSLSISQAAVAYIGGYWSDGAWQWTTGTPFNYSHFQHSLTSGRSGVAIVIQVATYQENMLGDWLPENDYKENPYICQSNQETHPSTTLKLTSTEQASTTPQAIPTTSPTEHSTSAKLTTAVTTPAVHPPSTRATTASVLTTSPQTPAKPIPKWVWIFLGVTIAVILVVLCVILMCVVCTRLRRKRKKKEVHSNTSQLSFYEHSYTEIVERPLPTVPDTDDGYLHPIE